VGDHEPGALTGTPPAIDFMNGCYYIGKQIHFPMNNSEITAKSLTPEDKAILLKLKGKAWLSLLRVYPLLFLALGYIYFKMHFGGTIRGYKVGHDLTPSQYNLVYAIFAAFFGCIFLFFMIRDFRRLILPFQKDVRADKKRCFSFSAKKYQDPFTDKCLLFYPGKEDIYIEICAEDFESIGNGDELYLEVAYVTGEVLVLKSPSRVFKAPAEFSYSDR
jgi:hypothetical protein